MISPVAPIKPKTAHLAGGEQPRRDEKAGPTPVHDRLPASPLSDIKSGLCMGRSVDREQAPAAQASRFNTL